ncbi:Fcf2-domain-containing protein [Lichtheimia hyalospora FSU 10163]|nr:Fcf2-domain-containing protein [Lichtheimia hyalospora FSU 10163]
MPLTRSQLRRLSTQQEDNENESHKSKQGSADQKAKKTDLVAKKPKQRSTLSGQRRSTRNTPQVIAADSDIEDEQSVASSDNDDQDIIDTIHDNQSTNNDGSEDNDDDNDSEENDDDDDDSEEEEDSEDDSSDDDDDLDELLNKAQKALDLQQQSQDTKKTDEKPIQSRLPKLESGINMREHLYIKRNGAAGAARLKKDTVAIEDEDETNATKRSIEVVKASKEKAKPLSRKERQIEREKTTGKGWFDMPKPEMTPELQRDLQVLKMRHVIDPKRHYRKMGKKEEFKYFQMGTVVEGATEFFSSRLTRKERKRTIVDELLADDKARTYHKRKHLEAFSRGKEGRKKAKRQMKQLSRS